MLQENRAKENLFEGDINDGNDEIKKEARAQQWRGERTNGEQEREQDREGEVVGDGGVRCHCVYEKS